jgi:transcriptional regulator
MAGNDLIGGTLTVLILKAVSGRPLHGYGIGRWIRDRSSEVLSVQEGVLYIALQRLKSKGWLDESWGTTGTGREAKFYRLTPAGRKHLNAELRRWRSHTEAAAAALGLERT